MGFGFLAAGAAAALTGGMMNNKRKRAQKLLDHAQASLDKESLENDDKNAWYANNVDHGASTMSKNNRTQTSKMIKANNDSIRDKQKRITEEQSYLNNKGGLF